MEPIYQGVENIEEELKFHEERRKLAFDIACQRLADHTEKHHPIGYFFVHDKNGKPKNLSLDDIARSFNIPAIIDFPRSQDISSPAEWPSLEETDLTKGIPLGMLSNLTLNQGFYINKSPKTNLAYYFNRRLAADPTVFPTEPIDKEDLLNKWGIVIDSFPAFMFSPVKTDDGYVTNNPEEYTLPKNKRFYKNRSKPKTVSPFLKALVSKIK